VTGTSVEPGKFQIPIHLRRKQLSGGRAVAELTDVIVTPAERSPFISETTGETRTRSYRGETQIC
jgi:hypothetical protein